MLEVFRVFLRLGLTSFGGPIAHLGYFRSECVARRKWLDEAAFADLVALCQFLPGPASSQVGFAIGWLRAGALGAITAWTAFTLPSALALFAFAYGARGLAGPLGEGALHGLKLAAVAIVAQAVSGMAKTLCPDRERAGIAALALALVCLAPSSVTQLAAIAAGGLIGLALCRAAAPPAPTGVIATLRPSVGLALIALYALLLALSFAPSSGGLALFSAFYRAGALVFGGGHVVLPLLRETVVAPGYVSADAFLAGYGAAQAVPGPLFTFSAYLGALASIGPGGVAGAFIALIALSLPGLILVAGVLPFWRRLSGNANARAAMAGLNAAVVGLIGAALYDPVFVSSVVNARDLAVAALGFIALVGAGAPPLAVVAFCAVAGVSLRLAA